MKAFSSDFERKQEINLPEFSNTRIMMMPIMLGDTNSIPSFLDGWKPALESMFEMQDHNEKVGYLTIDEKIVAAGSTHRRAGKHVDGIYKNAAGGWGGGGGGWGGGIEPTPGLDMQKSTGMLTVSSTSGCKAWKQIFNGWPDDEGSCDHLSSQCKEKESEIFSANTVYWVDALCVHESMEMERDTKRQFVRLSLPSTAPWFEGYTENPLGILPTGDILERRDFMSM